MVGTVDRLDARNLTRKVYDLPDYVVKALDENALWGQYRRMFADRNVAATVTSIKIRAF